MSVPQRIPYYVAIAICIKNPGYCCVYIGTEPVTDVLCIHADYKYAIHTVFTFCAAKKATYSTIMTNLYYSGIYPLGDINSYRPFTNPNNKYYTDLLVSDVPKIIYIIRRSIAGINITKSNDTFVSLYDERTNTNERINEIISQERPQISLNFNGSFILTPTSALQIYDFDQAPRDDM
jgi:hypothetical protein